MRSLLDADYAAPRALLFMKQMAHHLVALDLAFLQETTSVFLIRDPRDMLPSLTMQLPDAGLADTGLATQWQLFEQLANDGHAPVVIDSRQLLIDPAGVLALLCTALDIPFDEKMLGWTAGARSEDGIWARYWYDAVHRSTGFQPYREKGEFPGHLNELLDECRPYYDKLCAYALRSTRN